MRRVTTRGTSPWRGTLALLGCAAGCLGAGCATVRVEPAPARARRAAAPREVDGAPGAGGGPAARSGGAVVTAVGAGGHAAVVSIDVDGAPLAGALDALARQVGWNVACDGSVDARVTLRLRDVPWPVALALLLEQARCEAAPVAPRLLLVTQPPRVTLVSGALVGTTRGR